MAHSARHKSKFSNCDERPVFSPFILNFRKLILFDKTEKKNKRENDIIGDHERVAERSQCGTDWIPENLITGEKDD